ncbi:hypothetical protein B4U80_12931 [Leptotrombidium deliense]|uniref:Sushi domain-containing protein n=1 Tax=Leptotrombidium deliense TaxID=299467 RepID=A0A443SH15_9ACAR|nr:hypothetical protein B4U80_12931 [Leptotrombidium deliense]
MFTIILICVIFIHNVHSDCGQPPLPLGVRIFDKDEKVVVYQTKYVENEVITYRCEHPNELITREPPSDSPEPFWSSKSSLMRCEKGIWVGNDALCANSHRLIKSIEYIIADDNSTINNKAIFANQGKERSKQHLNHCAYNVTTSSNKPQIWTVNLRRNVSIAFIKLELNLRLPIYVINYGNRFDSSDEAPLSAIVGHNRHCSLNYISNIKKRGSVLHLLCELQDEHKDEKVDHFTLNFDSAISRTNFTVNSLCIFSYPKKCGIPQIPLHVKVQLADYDNIESYSYECIQYSPKGLSSVYPISDMYYSTFPSTITCLQDAKWSAKIRECKPITTCPLTELQGEWNGNQLLIDNKTGEYFEYNNAQYFDGNLVAIPSTIETHWCASQFRENRICTENGIWKGAITECHNELDSMRRSSVEIERQIMCTQNSGHNSVRDNVTPAMYYFLFTCLTYFTAVSI